jgi:hypothetical protein
VCDAYPNRMGVTRDEVAIDAYHMKLELVFKARKCASKGEKPGVRTVTESDQYVGELRPRVSLLRWAASTRALPLRLSNPREARSSGRFRESLLYAPSSSSSSSS